MARTGNAGRLLAISDLHITYPENRRIVESLRPEIQADWLVVCGDISESSDDIEWALRLLKERFSTVIWVPGNHDLWTVGDDHRQLRGARRYDYLIALCRAYRRAHARGCLSGVGRVWRPGNGRAAFPLI